MLHIDSLETPLGTIHLAARGDALVALNFGAPLDGEPARSEARGRLRAYFHGEVRALDELRVDPAGTPFQKRVWSLLRQIPAGETRSYLDLARILGSHPRAVGAANGANPVALVIPCHRVIAKDGSLCGYAYGQERKRWLIEHERSAAAWPALKRAANSPLP
jgi:methylated-DNA-[protein]-cysteine S-methyltransferase